MKFFNAPIINFGITEYCSGSCLANRSSPQIAAAVTTVSAPPPSSFNLRDYGCCSGSSRFRGGAAARKFETQCLGSIVCGFFERLGGFDFSAHSRPVEKGRVEKCRLPPMFIRRNAAMVF